jgi:hypothetical protein
MKKFLILFLILTLGCSSNDESTNEELIIGEWRYVRYTYEEDGVVLNDNLSNECTSQSRYFFYSNNEYDRISYGGTSLASCSDSQNSGAFDLSGNNINMSSFRFGNTSSFRFGTFEVTNSTLQLTFKACNSECEYYNNYYYEKVNE